MEPLGVTWMFFGGMLAITAALEHGMIYVRHGSIKYFSCASLSTAMGVMLMMVSPHGWVYGVVVAAALAQKHFLTVEGEHFFNPSNFALMVGLVLFYDQMHLVLGQLGDALWLRAVVVALALAILIRVDRWIIPVAFAGAYLLLEYGLVVGYDPVMVFETILERFYGVSFVVFVAFMLTDPRTTPSARRDQAIFGVLVALVAVGLDRWHGFRVQHLFMALFVLSPWIPWLRADDATRAGRFLWGSILFFVAVGAIIYLENLPPYYMSVEQ
jgi:hypothetical protein